MTLRLLSLGLVLVPIAACSGGDDPDSPDPETVEPGSEAGPCSDVPDLPARDEYGSWIPVRLNGAVCGEGQPYQFFVYYQEGSNDLDITMEPGGGCWDYDTCTGNAPGRLGVRQLDPASDDHMTALPPPLGEDEDAVPWGLIFPHYGLSDGDVPTANFNHVHLPYCTGDAFLGSFSAEYESGDDSIEVHHQGRTNMELVAEWLEEEFPAVGQLLVLGSSAGGLGAMFNYPLLRDSVAPQCSALINDSSPIFVGDGPQAEARQAYVEDWQLDGLLAELSEELDDDSEELFADVGELSALLSDKFPGDRFLVTFFQRDLNNSQFSYAHVTNDLSEANLNTLWAEDTALLTEHLDELDNWGYYIPHFRSDNCSHTVSLLPLGELENPSYIADGLAGTADGYLRTDFNLADGTEVSFRTALERVLDTNSELPSWVADTEPDAEFTEEELSFCLD